MAFSAVFFISSSVIFSENGAAVILGIPTTSFITLLASAGLAIGMAFQGSLSNFAGGVLLLLHKPFREGDYIESQTFSEN